MGNELGQMFDLAWKLLLVLGLAVLALRGLRWLSSPAVGSKSPLQMLSRLPVGPQQAVVLIAVGKKRLLLGQSPQQVTLLAELSEEDLVNAEVDQSSHVPQPPTALARLALLSSWQRIRSNSNRGGPEPAKSNDGPEANQSDSFLLGLQRVLTASRRNETTAMSLPPERGVNQ